MHSCSRILVFTTYTQTREHLLEFVSPVRVALAKFNLKEFLTASVRFAATEEISPWQVEIMDLFALFFYGVSSVHMKKSWLYYHQSRLHFVLLSFPSMWNGYYQRLLSVSLQTHNSLFSAPENNSSLIKRLTFTFPNVWMLNTFKPTAPNMPGVNIPILKQPIH